MSRLPLGPESSTAKYSSPSSSGVRGTSTGTVLWVSPVLKVTMPVAAVKSVPAVALVRPSASAASAAVSARTR